MDNKKCVNLIRELIEFWVNISDYKNKTKFKKGGIMKTEEQLELEDLKNKDQLIRQIIAICKSNRDNDYCCTYQLKDMIEKTFKMWGY